jgi:hypothetical protein
MDRVIEMQSRIALFNPPWPRVVFVLQMLGVRFALIQAPLDIAQTLGPKDFFASTALQAQAQVQLQVQAQSDASY